MSEVRLAAVAGIFYPSRAGELKESVEQHLSRAPHSVNGGRVKAIIAPHAGYIYSGPTAGFAFRPLQEEMDSIRRIVLLGPAHRLPVDGLALPGASGFETPLGIAQVDQELVRQIASMAQVTVNAAAHAPEHSLEVELPFLQVTLEGFTVLPLLTGVIGSVEVAEVLDRVWGGSETRIVVSSDLSHYLGYDFARQVDRQTAEQILQLRAGVSHRRACGATAINGLLVAARWHGLQPALLDLRNSGDTAGDRSQVVGYGAFAFCEGT